MGPSAATAYRRVSIDKPSLVGNSVQYIIYACAEHGRCRPGGARLRKHCFSADSTPPRPDKNINDERKKEIINRPFSILSTFV